MDSDFLSLVDSTISNAIKETYNFYDLIIKCAGIHPIELISSLDRMHHNGSLDNQTYRQIIHSISDLPKHQNNVGYKKILPIPHQVDYDWRFSENGMHFFIERINNQINNKSVKRIAFIGSPSLFRYYCEDSRKNTEYFLIDFNANKHIKKETLPTNAHIVDCNLNYDLNIELKVDQIYADIIVMDPPWYPEYYKKFFEICDIVGASKCLVLGVFPPMLTRESVSIERSNMDLFVKGLGFDKLQYEPLCIEYYTPPFEQNVFRVNKIVNYPMCWRKGDFFITRRVNKMSNNLNNSGIVIRNGSWTEKNIGNVRFKLHQSTYSEDIGFSVRFDSLYENDIYPSVSRRFKGHEKINVWTSGNRVFYCSNIPILFMIFEHLYDNDIVLSFEDEYGEIIPDLQREQIKNVQNSFRFIVDLELKEYGVWSR